MSMQQNLKTSFCSKYLCHQELPLLFHPVPCLYDQKALQNPVLLLKGDFSKIEIHADL